VALLIESLEVVVGGVRGTPGETCGDQIAHCLAVIAGLEGQFVGRAPSAALLPDLPLIGRGRVLKGLRLGQFRHRPFPLFNGALGSGLQGGNLALLPRQLQRDQVAKELAQERLHEYVFSKGEMTIDETVAAVMIDQSMP